MTTCATGSCCQLADSAFPDRRLRALGRARGGVAARRGRAPATLARVRCDARSGRPGCGALPLVARGACATRRALADARRARATRSCANHVANRASRAQGRAFSHAARASSPAERSRARASAARRGSRAPRAAVRRGAARARRRPRRRRCAAVPVRHGARRALGGRAARARRHATRRSGCRPSCAPMLDAVARALRATLDVDDARADRAAARSLPGRARPAVLAAVSVLSQDAMSRRPCGHDTARRTTTRTSTGPPGPLPRARRAASRATISARAFTVGIGGPVGSGKTALLLALCRALRDALQPRRRHQRHLHARGRRVPASATRRCPPSASARSRPAAARTRRSARTSATTSSRSRS